MEPVPGPTVAQLSEIPMSEGVIGVMMTFDGTDLTQVSRGKNPPNFKNSKTISQF